MKINRIDKIGDAIKKRRFLGNNYIYPFRIFKEDLIDKKAGLDEDKMDEFLLGYLYLIKETISS